MSNGVLLNRLEYPQSSELVAVYGKPTRYEKVPIAYLNFLDWQREAHTFSSLAIYRSEDHNLTGSEERERLSEYMVTWELFFDVARQVGFGTPFRNDDDQLGEDTVVVTPLLQLLGLGGPFSAPLTNSDSDN